jgi:hypothetical protein
MAFVISGLMMKLEEFNAGIYRKKYQYESFSPNPINIRPLPLRSGQK